MKPWGSPSASQSGRSHAPWVTKALDAFPEQARKLASALGARELERLLVDAALDAAEALAAELKREREYQVGSIRGVTMYGLAKRYAEIVDLARQAYRTGESPADVYEILEGAKRALLEKLDRDHHAYYAELNRKTGRERLERALEALQ